MPCSVLAWDREVPVSLKFVSARGRSGDTLPSVGMGQAGPCPLRLASARGRSGDALFSVGIGQGGPCLP
jgi:hypothetical protein